MKQMFSRIAKKILLLTIIVRAGFEKDGIEFFTPDDFSRQLDASLESSHTDFSENCYDLRT